MSHSIRSWAMAATALGLIAATPAAKADTAEEIRAIRAQMSAQAARLKQLEAQVVKQKEEKAKKAAEQKTGGTPLAVASAPAAAPAPKHWYERINVRGYTQMRYNAILDGGPYYNDISTPNDRSVGPRQNFLIRRARLIFSGDISDHLYLYLQPDFASIPSGSFSNSPTMAAVPWLGNSVWGRYNQYGTYSSAAGYFAQLRDAYADIYIDEKKEFRVRAGQSKIPYGFENMQSSQNRLALDRADAINSCCKDERDLGLFFYYTPENIRHVFRDLVKNNLKGSGDYGVFGVGVYNGQGANRIDLNKGTHVVARLTYPYTLPNGQIVEASVQGYTGRFVPYTTAITPSLFGASNFAGFRPTWLANLAPAGVPFVEAPGYFNLGNYNLGTYPSSSAWVPVVANGGNGIRDERLAVTGVIYPQPFGLKAEWNWGRGPALNETQTAIGARSLNGGYVEATYKYDDKEFGTGTWFPFVKYQYFRGGQKFENNAPMSRLNEWDFGVEWQPIPEVEVTAVYSKMDRTNTLAAPYRQFQANLMRMQLQWNY